MPSFSIRSSYSYKVLVFVLFVIVFVRVLVIVIAIVNENYRKELLPCYFRSAIIKEFVRMGVLVQSCPQGGHVSKYVSYF